VNKLGEDLFLFYIFTAKLSSFTHKTMPVFMQPTGKGLGFLFTQNYSQALFGGVLVSQEPSHFTDCANTRKHLPVLDYIRIRKMSKAQP